MSGNFFPTFLYFSEFVYSIYLHIFPFLFMINWKFLPNRAQYFQIFPVRF